MHKLFTIATLSLAAVFLQGSAIAQVSSLTVSNGAAKAHFFPTVSDAPVHRAIATASGPLVYHGGKIMPTHTLFAIFWLPSALQTGAATSMPLKYRTVQTNLLKNYPGHGIANNNTQYSQVVSNATTFIQNKGGFSGSYLDTSPYPASDCTDSVTPGNCITDAKIQAEVKKVMGIKGWTGGVNKIFLVFTSSGEGSCFDTNPADGCAYTDYCAYHSYIGGTTPIIYSNQPYGKLYPYCQASGVPSPNNAAVADAAASIATHEITEAITDPFLDAWYTTAGYEIGDLCAYTYGTNGWNSGKANQSWNGSFYELQEEWDNHTNQCVQLGP